MKSSIYHISFLFFFLPLLSFGQQPGFNYIKETKYPRSHFRDMIIDNDTIVGIGIGFNDSIQWKQGVVLMKLDSSGNLLHSNIVLDSLGDKLAVDKHWGKIIKTADGGYAMTAATVYRKSAFLIKVSHDLEVEFIKEYPDTVNLANFQYTPVEIQGGYILYGAIQRPNFRIDSFIRRVDLQGNTVWFKYYGAYGQDDAIVDLKMVNDSVMVAASVDGLDGTPNGSARSTIRYINLDGEVVQSWASLPEPEIGYLRKIIPLDDGGLLTYGVYVVYITQFGTKVVQSTIAKFSPGFQTDWIKHYGLIRSLGANIQFWDIEQTIDGSFIGAGESAILLPDSSDAHAGWLFKFSPNGDSIWSRYDVAPFPFKYYNVHFFGGVGVLSSGSIVAGGSASEGQKKYIWLIKVTNDGCLDTLFCGLVDAGEVWPGKEIAEVRVYPNPASEKIIIETEKAIQGGEIMLYNLQGIPVLQKPVPALSNSTEINTSGFVPGIYFVEIRSRAGIFHRSKIVIQH